MIFHGFTISALGHCAHKQDYDSAKLGQPAVAYLTSLLENHGNRFQAIIPLRGVGKINLDWSSDHLSCAVATFSAEGELLTTNVVVSGINPEADERALQTGQVALERVCAAAGAQPARDLVDIRDRPAAASIRWSSRTRKTMDLLADMEVCLAAAFLERAFRTGKPAL